MVVVQHAGTGAAVSGASSGCQLSSEQLTVTCLAPLPLKLLLVPVCDTSRLISHKEDIFRISYQLLDIVPAVLNQSVRA